MAYYYRSGFGGDSLQTWVSEVKKILDYKKLMGLLIDFDWSRQDLADMLGVKIQTVYCWMCGVRTPSKQSLLLMAAHFKVPLKSLLKGKTYGKRRI